MDTAKNFKLNRYLSPLNVWALSFGCAVGWGAFVMPGTTFLPIAGPIGTAIGMTIGGIVMAAIGFNYHYMMNRYPDAGGTYSYSKKIFGYDHGFLSAWFLILVYIAITWANATALPLIFRKLLGDFFQVGFHYQIFGYDVYLGEALLSLFSIWLFGFICIRGGKCVAYIQTILALILFGGILIGFGAAVISNNGNLFSTTHSYTFEMEPGFAIFSIAVLSPWAFSGFESISHSVEEFTFSVKKSFVVMIVSILSGAVAYIALAFMAVAVIPPEYINLNGYIHDIGNLSGLASLPTFNTVNVLLGQNGLIMLGLTVVAAVATGLIGNSIAASRLLHSMSRDDLFPEKFGSLNSFHTPKNILLFIMLISIPIPFLGRTAISWIIDVNTIGTTIAYAYTSAVAFKKARDEKYLPAQITGLTGTIVSVLFFLYFMIPSFWTVSAMSTESYLILIAWSMIGFVFFRYIFKKDTERRFGKSTVTWIALLFLIFFTSTIWLRQANHATTNSVLNGLNDYYVEKLNEHGFIIEESEKENSKHYLEMQMNFVNESLRDFNLIQITIIVMNLFIMFNIYNMMMRREREMEIQKMEAEQSNKAKTNFLSNMSHDIRTPMNAIIGYTTLLRKEKNLPPKADEYLNKIEASNKHLLALINDILDMSRIESGKMELNPIKADLIKTMDEVRDMFATQMITKSIEYTVKTENITNKTVLCDTNYLNRVLLNLISNAYKFTSEGGKVSVTLKQVGANEGVGSYELKVKDTGMGMSPEFAAKVFEAYSRDKTVNKIQGTGLGMAITKSIVELMNGIIEVKSKKGKGTEFIVKINFPLVEEETVDENEKFEENKKHEINFKGMKILLVEDNLVNREIASLILTEFGFVIDTAENGKEAVEKFSASKAGDYDLILMDVQMPIMNGYEASKEIRKLKNPQLANIPIIAMTANAFSEDIQAAKDAGMNSHIAKPIDIPKMIETLTEVLT